MTLLDALHGLSINDGVIRSVVAHLWDGGRNQSKRRLDAAARGPLATERHLTIHLSSRAAVCKAAYDAIVEIISGNLVASTNAVAQVPRECPCGDGGAKEQVHHQGAQEGPRLDLVDAVGDHVVLARHLAAIAEERLHAAVNVIHAAAQRSRPETDGLSWELVNTVGADVSRGDGAHHVRLLLLLLLLMESNLVLLDGLVHLLLLLLRGLLRNLGNGLH